jgi:hypothetical protein
MLALSTRWAEFFRTQPETGMSYHVVTVVLRDGRRYKQAVVVGGYLTKIRGFNAIPFAEADIDHFIVTHRKWDWQ